MSLFRREPSSAVTKAEFQVRPPGRRARTSWLAPPNTTQSVDTDEEISAPRAPAVPKVDSPPPPRPRSERPPEPRSTDEAPAAVPHPPTIHAAFIVNHGQARLTELIDRLAASIELLAGERARILARVESQLIELARAMAQRVISRELTVDPTLLADLAAEGIEALGDKERLVVRLGDLDDDAQIDAIRRRVTARVPDCQVIHDPSLARGACVVETEYGRVDESLEARLARVVDAMGTKAKEVSKP